MGETDIINKMFVKRFSTLKNIFLCVDGFKKSPKAKRSLSCINRSVCPTNRYETLIILRPDMLDEEKDRQLAKYEAFLTNQCAEDIDCVIKGRQTMSYPIDGHWDGLYVLFRFAASGVIAKSVQKTLANPDVETQGNIIRWANFRAE